MTNANEAFAALAQNYSKYSDIPAQSHVSNGPALADVLERLIRMTCCLSVKTFFI